MKVLAFGEILCDRTGEDERPGGAPFDFATQIVKHGVKAAIISRLGTDELGERAYGHVLKAGVDTSLIQRDDAHPTGIVDRIPRNGFLVYEIQKNAAFDYIDYAGVKSKIKLNGFDALYFGTLAQRNPVSCQTLAKIIKYNSFQYIFYDVNLTDDLHTKSVMESSLKACSILKVNMPEVSRMSILLFDEGLSTLTEFCESVARCFSIDIIIITTTDKDCFIFDKNQLRKIDVQKMYAPDVPGASATFSATFIFEYAMKRDVVSASMKANKSALQWSTQKMESQRSLKY